jgi:hypothetical protein
MNYIIPRIFTCPTIRVCNWSEHTYSPVISHSLFYREQMVKTYAPSKNIFEIIQSKYISMYDIMKNEINHTVHNMFQDKVVTSSFFDLVEIMTAFNICNICDASVFEILYPNNTQVQFRTLHVEDQSNSSRVAMDYIMSPMIKAISSDKFIVDHCSFVTDTGTNNIKIGEDKSRFDFIYFDCTNDLDTGAYISNSMGAFYKILTETNQFGCSIIKINELWFAPMIEIICGFCYMFNNVYVSKPTTCNATTNHRYIICLGFDISRGLECKEKMNFSNEINDSTDINELSDVPCHVIEKIHESNIAIGRQRLEIIDQTINFTKSKLIDEKNSLVARTVYARSVQWLNVHKLS